MAETLETENLVTVIPRYFDYRILNTHHKKD